MELPQKRLRSFIKRVLVDGVAHDANGMSSEGIHNYVTIKCVQVVLAQENGGWIINGVTVCFPFHELLATRKLLECPSHVATPSQQGVLLGNLGEYAAKQVLHACRCIFALSQYELFRFENTVDIDIDERIVTAYFIDTFLLYPTSLARQAEIIGEAKIDDHGYRSSGNMLRWYENDPEGFGEYSMKDAEITVRFYMRYLEKLKEWGLASGGTVGSIYERTLFKILLAEDRLGLSKLGYKVRSKRRKGKVIGRELVVTQTAETL